MIDINKKYRTRDGREVRIYATDGRGTIPVHGAIFSEELGWGFFCWRGDGSWADNACGFDLIEVKPRIKRMVWLNVFPKTIATYFHRLDADTYAGSSRLACVKVEIDCEEGEGL